VITDLNALLVTSSAPNFARDRWGQDNKLAEARANARKWFIAFAEERAFEFFYFTREYNCRHSSEALSDSDWERLFISYLDQFVSRLSDKSIRSRCLELRKEHFNLENTLTLECGEVLREALFFPRRFLKPLAKLKIDQLRNDFPGLTGTIPKIVVDFWRLVFKRPSFINRMEDGSAEDRKKFLEVFFQERVNEFVVLKKQYSSDAAGDKIWLKIFKNYLDAFISTLGFSATFGLGSACPFEREKKAFILDLTAPENGKVSFEAVKQARSAIFQYADPLKGTPIQSSATKKSRNKRASGASRPQSPIQPAPADSVVQPLVFGSPVSDRLMYPLEAVPPVIESKFSVENVLLPVQSHEEAAFTGDSIRAEKVSIVHPRVGDLARLLLLAMTFEIRGKQVELNLEGRRVLSVRYACVSAMMRQFHTLPTADQLLEALLREKNVNRNKLDQELSGFRIKYESFLENGYYRNHFYDLDKKINEDDIREVEFRSFDKTEFIASINENLQKRYQQEQEQEARRQAQEAAIAAEKELLEKQERARDFFNIVQGNLCDGLIQDVLKKFVKFKTLYRAPLFVTSPTYTVPEVEQIDSAVFLEVLENSDKPKDMLYRVIYTHQKLGDIEESQGGPLLAARLFNLLWQAQESSEAFSKEDIEATKKLVKENIEEQKTLLESLEHGFSKLQKYRNDLGLEVQGDEQNDLLADAIRVVIDVCYKPLREKLSAHTIILNDDQRKEARDGLILDFKHKFQAEVKNNKVLTQYEGFGEWLWAKVKNVLLFVIFPVGIYRAVSRGKQNLPVFFGSTRSELMADTEQRVLASLAQPGPAINRR
jgi:hypothetical protein